MAEGERSNSTASSMKRRDMRILWQSNGFWSQSGYAVFTRDILFRLRDDGWPLAHVAFWGLQGHPATIDGIYTYPVMGNPFGADAMFNHAMDFKADVVFTMQDVWPLDPNLLRQIKTWIPYLPIDKSPVPGGVIRNLNFAYKILTFAKFGQEELEKVGFTSTFIPEGTDVNIFKPLDKQACRKELGLPPDVFLFTMVAANKENPPRKGFQEAMEAFKTFADRHPEARLFITVQQTDPGGFPIIPFARHLKILDKIIYKSDYFVIHKNDSDYICKLYNASDVLLHPSQTEGFGLCIVESQACGTPVIIQNCQSMPELIIDGKTGWGAETLHKRFTNDEGYVNVVDTNSVYSQMEKSYKALKENEEQVSNDCREHIVNNFNIDTLFKERWLPLLESLQEELLPVAKTEQPVIQST